MDEKNPFASRFSNSSWSSIGLSATLSAVAGRESICSSRLCSFLVACLDGLESTTDVRRGTPCLTNSLYLFDAIDAGSLLTELDGDKDLPLCLTALSETCSGFSVARGRLLALECDFGDKGFVNFLPGENVSDLFNVLVSRLGV